MAEIWDLYDEDGKLTGETLERGGNVPVGRFNRIVRVWIRDDQGRFLISQRHPGKSSRALDWEPVGGAVVAGEDRLTGAQREVAEELGLDLPKKRFVLIDCERRDWGQDFLDTYLVHWNGELSELTPQESEVADVKWASWQELCALADAGKLSDMHSGYRTAFADLPHVPAAICPMTMEDYDEIHALWERTPGMGVNDHDDSPEGIERFLKRNPGCCFVAKSAAGVIGASLAGHDGRRGNLYHTAVAEEAQGMGIGRALVNACINALKQHGVGKVSIHVFADNDSGNRFWEKYGFVARPDISYQSYKVVEMKETHTK